MRRREFISLIGGVASWSFGAPAQQSNTMKRIAIATPSASVAEMSGGDYFRDQVEAGGLIAYSHEVKGPARRNATQIVEIFHGKQPSDMPYIQEAKFELLINLKTATALGLSIPPSLLVRAVEMIE